MFVALTSNGLDQITSNYALINPPLAKCYNRAQAQDIEWWLSSPKADSETHQRKQVALRLYFEISRHCALACAVGCFPAVFDLSDGARRRPDKGVIKSLLAADPPWIRVVTRSDELTFELTQAGRARVRL